MTIPTSIYSGKVLIVDDKGTGILLLERMLRNAGYISIDSTTNPHAVCELQLRNAYDLIILDLEMPDMNGFQVMESLREIERDKYLPVLVVSAHPAHKLRALRAGAKDFVCKPFEMPEVLARVHNMLEVRLLHEAALSRGKMLESLARNDPLTGLANRRLLAERMSMAIAHARRKKAAMAVVYIDLDCFKQINDTLGHDAGDVLLKLVAGRLETMTRGEDTLARLGGDEFLIMLTDINNAGSAVTVAVKVIEMLSRPYDIEGHAVNITTSVGVGIYPVHGEDANTLIKSADLAMYEAKRAGKNAYRISNRTAPGPG